MSTKRKFTVNIYKRQECEDYEKNFEYLIGTEETYAVSEKQAINNIKFRFGGKYSQYKPISTSGHYEDWIVYKIKENCYAK